MVRFAIVGWLQQYDYYDDCAEYPQCSTDEQFGLLIVLVLAGGVLFVLFAALMGVIELSKKTTRRLRWTRGVVHAEVRYGDKLAVCGAKLWSNQIIRDRTKDIVSDRTRNVWHVTCEACKTRLRERGWDGTVHAVVGTEKSHCGAEIFEYYLNSATPTSEREHVTCPTCTADIDLAIQRYENHWRR